MRTRHKAILAGALALALLGALLLFRDDGAGPQPVNLAAIAATPPRETPPDADPIAAARPRSGGVPAAPAPPIIDLVQVEKQEVCEGEENLVTVHAHTADGNDAFLHYTIAGEAGSRVPVRTYIGRDGRPPLQDIVAFGRDNVATRIALPPYRVKNCRPARMLLVTMRMLPNSSSEREFTATVQNLDGTAFAPAWYEWSFGDDSFDSTAGPVAVHDYGRLPQRNAFTDLLVKVKALDGGGQSVEGRFALQIRNVAFHTRQRGLATIFAEPSPRFPAAGPDGIVRQKFRLWHSEDDAVQITGATMARLSLPARPGGTPPPPRPVAVDPGPFPHEIPAGETREHALEHDFTAEPGVYGVVYEIQGVTRAGMQARGEMTLLRPPPRPTRENSVAIEDPAMMAKIRRAMTILQQETVSQEDLWRLEREGKLQ